MKSFRNLFVITCFAIGGILSCNENVHIEIPATPEAPVITSFSPEDCEIGTQIEIVGRNLALADSVYIGDKLIKLVSRITDNLLVAEVIAGAPAFGLITVSSPFGKGSSSRECYTTYSYPVFNTTEAEITNVTVNGITVIKGEKLDAVSEVYFNGNIKGDFAFKGKDSIGILIPIINTASTNLTCRYPAPNAAGYREKVYSNITVSLPTVMYDNHDNAISGKLMTIDGQNLNLVQSVRLGSTTLKMLPYASDNFRITAVVPRNLAAGTYSLDMTTIGGSVTEPGIVVSSAPSPTVVNSMTFEDIETNALAFRQNINIGNSKYWIYNIPGFTNKVVESPYEGVTAPQGSKFGRLYVNYDTTGHISGGNEPVGGSTFAELTIVPKDVAAEVSSKIIDPILHFRINTNGKGSALNKRPSLIVVVYLNTGEVFPNGANRCRFRLRGNLEYDNQWHLYAMPLNDIKYIEGSTSDEKFTVEDLEYGIARMFLNGKIGEIRLQVTTDNGSGYEIEINIDDIFISDQIDNTAIDLTSRITNS